MIYDPGRWEVLDETTKGWRKEDKEDWRCNKRKGGRVKVTQSKQGNLVANATGDS